MQYQKVKDVAKVVVPKGRFLTERVLTTMQRVSDIVGSTLGPGGSSVLIERQEQGMPSILTKDGVTVFRSLAFDDPVAQEIMASARDAAIRTADSAGDGTTTATILAEAIIRLSHNYMQNNPETRPQKIVREMQRAFETTIEPAIKDVSRKAKNNRDWLYAVAKVSANGDGPLADAVLECFDKVGDDGNVTLLEMSGPSGYSVDVLKGYPVVTGYEESCQRFYGLFINDTANQRVYLEKPVFLLYHGNIVDIQSIQLLMEQIGAAWESGQFPTHNVVVCATGFSESVLATLAANFRHSATINVYPLLCPRTPEQEGSQKILEDLSALTGATVFNSITKPLDTATFSDLGLVMDYFEAGRTRSSVVGDGDELRILDRVEALKVQAANAISILDRSYIEERIGKLTGGIAKLTVIGSSTGELREKRDRAEDAVMAVRGAIKHGVLPAGGWGLLYSSCKLRELMVYDPCVYAILDKALWVPVLRLFSNVGQSEKEAYDNASVLFNKISNESISGGSYSNRIFDVWDGSWVDAYETGLLDSVPAVLEAIRNSLSIASLLGTLGGVVCYKRDTELERAEARSSEEWNRNVNVDPTTYVSEADLRP